MPLTRFSMRCTSPSPASRNDSFGIVNPERGTSGRETVTSSAASAERASTWMSKPEMRPMVPKSLCPYRGSHFSPESPIHAARAWAASERES